MENNLESQIRTYYQQFGVGHQQRRNQLLGSISAVTRSSLQTSPVIRSRRLSYPVLKSALGLAAGLMIVLGAIFYIWSSNDTASNTETGSGITSLNPLSAKEIYATAIDQATKVTSLHFVWTTPNGNDNGASVEMWWSHPNQYRMAFTSNGLIMAGNENQHYKYDPVKKEWKVSEGTGLYMFPLEQLGRLFSNNDDRLTKQWIDESKIIHSEPVDYKGEKCLKVICVHQVSQNRYEYVIDARVGTDTRIPFYEVKQYSQPQGGRLMSHVEVLEVNKDYADDMFTGE